MCIRVPAILVPDDGVGPGQYSETNIYPNNKNIFFSKNIQMPAVEESVVRRRPVVVASPPSTTIVAVVAGPADEDGGGAKAKPSRGEGGGGGGGGALQEGAGKIVWVIVLDHGYGRRGLGGKEQHAVVSHLFFGQ